MGNPQRKAVATSPSAEFNSEQRQTVPVAEELEAPPPYSNESSVGRAATAVGSFGAEQLQQQQQDVDPPRQYRTSQQNMQTRGISSTDNESTRGTYDTSKEHMTVVPPRASCSKAKHHGAGCCCSSNGGCCGSDNGGCCFSDNGGCCFSDNGACCFSDNGACCFSDNGACCFSDNGGCCFSDHGGCCCC